MSGLINQDSEKISFKKSSINFNPINTIGQPSILENLKNVIPKKGPIKLK